MPSSRGSSRPRDRTQVSPIAGGFFVIWVIREAPLLANKVNHNAFHPSVHRTTASMAILHAVSPSHDTMGKPFAFTWWVHKYLGYHLCAVLCLVNQSCPTFCDPMDCSPGSSVHGILQARILEWVAMPSSRGSSQPRDRTQVSHIAGGFFYLQSHQGSPERVRLVFNGSLWFSLVGEGAHWTGNALLVALSCWPFRHLSVCDTAWNAGKLQKEISSNRSTTKHHQVWSTSKAGGWHLKEWLLRTGDPTNVTWMSRPVGHFLGLY